MIHIIESFFCGIAFSLGVTVAFYVRDLATVKGRAEIKEEWLKYAKQTEDRLAIQVSTMSGCLKEIRRNKEEK